MKSYEYLKPKGLHILFSKTSEVYSITPKGRLSKPYSMNWEKLGMSFSGFYLTLKTSEFPSNGKGCSLSEIAEDTQNPKYLVSDRAISGMIQRSLKWSRGGYVLLQEVGSDKTQRLSRLSVTALREKIEELDRLGMKLILRELTPNEKEAMQGFPKDWTKLEEG